jgi:twitching motility protein PilJ
MSAFSLKNLFARKPPKDAEASMTHALSFGTPDPSTATIEAGSTMGAGPDTGGDDSIVEEVDEVELISVPLLGRRTTTTHQRTLFTLLAISLVALGSIAFIAIRESDRVAQQVAASGGSLMQSQRLAKSVSQALIGSPQAFSEVSDSARVLAQTVRGLRDGNPEIRLARASDDLQPDIERILPLMERAEKNAKTVLDQQ